MRNYSLVLVLHPDLDENATRDLVEKVKGWITEDGGQVSKVDLWGKKHLAYPIRKQKDGQFVLVHSSFAPRSAAKLERNLRLAEPIMRFMISAA